MSTLLHHPSEDTTMMTSLSTTTSAMLQIATIAVSSVPSILASPITSPNSTSSMVSPSSSPKDEDKNSGQCELLGSFAILVQGALGALALLSLVYKRWRERPQRPVKIWAFDASKQVVGSILLHLANLAMAMFSSGQLTETLMKAAAGAAGAMDDDEFQPNPCSFYLLNLAIDTTIGIPILIVLLRLLHAGFLLTPLATPPESIKSGNYGQPAKATWWGKQCLIYFIGLILMKACVFVIFQLAPWIVVVGDWALRWTEGNKAVQIAFVMLIFPLIMNAMQYYIIDTFIKDNKPAEEEETYQGNEDNEDDRESEECGHEGSQLLGEEGALKKGPRNDTQRQTQRPDQQRLTSYDPDKDGQVETSTAESSSTASNGSDTPVQKKPLV